MAKRKAGSKNWSACKSVVKDWPAPGLRELVHELYELSPENRRFLHCRLLPQSARETLADAIAALKRLISPELIFNQRFRHIEARRIVDQFAKATDDDNQVAELLITDLKLSFSALSQVGDYEPIVDHLHASLNRLEKLFARMPLAAVAALIAPVRVLADRWGVEFGYGISDELTRLYSHWQEQVDKR